MAVMVPRPAATLILLREGMEVLMLQRTQNAAFLGGAYVFPGGSLDPQDNDMRRVVGLTEAQANARLQSIPAPSPTTSPRSANASRRPASSSRMTRMAAA